MLNKSWTEEALGIAISGGADFAELFFNFAQQHNIDKQKADFHKSAFSLICIFAGTL